jgi:hypothetical protein
MKRCYNTIPRTLACLALAATAAWADEKPSEATDPIELQANCDLTGYKNCIQTFSPPVAVPDNNAAGVTVGPCQLPDDGMLIADVIIDLKMSHTFVGDLIVTVGYDETCDGAIDAQAVVLCRPRGTGTTTPAPCGTGTGFGCGGNLVSTTTYLWDDTAAGPMAEGVCPTTIPGGCYGPSTAGGSPLAVFEGRRKGGCWFLNVADRAGLDTGSIDEWSVHILNEVPIAVEQASWAGVKVLYQ